MTEPCYSHGSLKFEVDHQQVLTPALGQGYRHKPLNVVQIKYDLCKHVTQTSIIQDSPPGSLASSGTPLEVDFLVCQMNSRFVKNECPSERYVGRRNCPETLWWI